jgi:hypothetical protein
MFGNVEPALHAHLFPRHRLEPDATRAIQHFALDWNGAPAFAEANHAELKARIAGAIRHRL